MRAPTLKDIKVSEDEILERIYMRMEEGQCASIDILKELEVEYGEKALRTLEEKGFLEIEKEGRIHLTEKGKKRASDIIRRHRLAEVLFHEVFDLEKEKLEGPACTFEHIISEELVDKICSFLGHPTHCPHGMPIPRGECCRLLVKEVKPLVEKLTEVPPGSVVKVHYIVPASKKVLQRLVSLGLHPGKKIKVLQKNPAYVLEIDGSLIAVDRDIAENIYVINK